MVTRTLSWMMGFPNTLLDQTGLELWFTSLLGFICLSTINIHKNLCKTYNLHEQSRTNIQILITFFRLPTSASHFQFSEELVCPAHSVVTAADLRYRHTGGAIKWKSEQSLSQLAADHLRRVSTLKST